VTDVQTRLNLAYSSITRFQDGLRAIRRRVDCLPSVEARDVGEMCDELLTGDRITAERYRRDAERYKQNTLARGGIILPDPEPDSPDDFIEVQQVYGFGEPRLSIFVHDEAGFCGNTLNVANAKALAAFLLAFVDREGGAG